MSMPLESLQKIKAFAMLLLAISVAFVLFYTAAGYKSFERQSHNADLLIKNVTILTLNDDSQVIKQGWIAIKDGNIIDIGNGPESYSAEETIDGEGKLAMPGLVNTHTHAAMTVFRGINDKAGLASWLQSLNYYESKLSPEDVYWGSLLGEIEMIKSGTTTFNDMYFFQDATLRSLRKSQIRAVINAPLTSSDGKLDLDRNFIKNGTVLPTVTFSLAPNPLAYFPLENLRKVNDMFKSGNFILHVHIEEDEDDKANSLKKYGLTPLEILEKSGLLQQKAVLVHSVNFTKSELDTLSKQPDVGISVNPKSNYKLSGSTAPLSEMLERNLAVGIGTDGAASSNSLDMFGQINFIAFALKNCDSQKSFCDGKNGIKAEKIIRMATLDGAKILGLDDKIGSLEIGKKADIILIDFDKAELSPSYNVYSTLVYNTTGSDVSDSIINGKIVMRDGKLTLLNEKEAVNKVNEIAKRIGKER